MLHVNRLQKPYPCTSVCYGLIAFYFRVWYIRYGTPQCTFPYMDYNITRTPQQNTKPLQICLHLYRDAYIDASYYTCTMSCVLRVCRTAWSTFPLGTHHFFYSSNIHKNMWTVHTLHVMYISYCIRLRESLHVSLIRCVTRLRYVYLAPFRKECINIFVQTKPSTHNRYNKLYLSVKYRCERYRMLCCGYKVRM